jgi:hypothetical protein
MITHCLYDYRCMVLHLLIYTTFIFCSSPVLVLRVPPLFHFFLNRNVFWTTSYGFSFDQEPAPDGLTRIQFANDGFAKSGVTDGGTANP